MRNTPIIQTFVLILLIFSTGAVLSLIDLFSY
ncbi:hypothetical protein PMI22_04477 [Pseudomonas sp. GM21]|nr:hypothetical protein PMI22_04477 [Pseudomonas sp. GM21]